MKRGDIIIPQTELEQLLARTDAAKGKMTHLLLDLERAATGKAIKTPGLWRHDPLGWLKQHDQN